MRDEVVVEPQPQPRALPAPRSRRTSSSELVRGRRIRVRRGQMLVPVGPAPQPTREVPNPLPPMQPIDMPQPEEASTAAERREWKLAFPHDGSDDEKRRAVDQFVIDLQMAINTAWRHREYTNVPPSALQIEQRVRDLGYRPSAIDDFRHALAEREGQLRVRRLLAATRRWRYWALALRAALDGWL